MSANIPFTKREMQIIRAILTIDPKAVFKIKQILRDKYDYKYGGVEFINCTPIKWEDIVEKIDEQKERRPY